MGWGNAAHIDEIALTGKLWDQIYHGSYSQPGQQVESLTVSEGFLAFRTFLVAATALLWRTFL